MDVTLTVLGPVKDLPGPHQGNRGTFEWLHLYIVKYLSIVSVYALVCMKNGMLASVPVDCSALHLANKYIESKYRALSAGVHVLLLLRWI